jgi:hypothetical protein
MTHQADASGLDSSPGSIDSRPEEAEPETRQSWRWKVGTVVLAAIGFVVLGTMFALVDPDTTPDTAEFFGFDVGDCTDRPSTGSEYFEVNQVSCDQRHSFEVFAFVEYEDGDDERWPDGETGVRLYQDLCTPEFLPYTGESRGQSEYSIYIVYPNRGAWNDGWRGGMCLLARYGAMGRLLTSVESGRFDEDRTEPAS